MLFSDIAIINENLEFEEHVWVGVEQGHISYLAHEKPNEHEAARFGDAYDGKNKLLMSGFYNAHSHAPMTLLRGYAESLPLQQWLFDKVFPFEDQIRAEESYWAMQLACAEMLRFGVVSMSDMYFNSRESIRAVMENGMKLNICEGFIANENKPYHDYPICDLNKALVAEFHHACGGRIKIDYNIHGEYTSNPLAVEGVAQAAREAGLRIQLHASETKLEHEECKQRHGGMTPIQYFDSLGVFENPTTAAHCVWVEDADIEILAEKKVFVACNPASNMKLGSGFAPLPALLDRGVCVALGTDGAASNNNHNMMQDLYLMCLIYKGAALDPTLITPEQGIYAATRAGALSQGRDDCGYIKQGAKADLCVLDTSGPSWCPSTNPLYNLVFSGQGADVCLTMIDGKVLYRDGIWPTIDIERAQAETQAATKRIISCLGDA
ncbi:MAG: amidohydrolase [Eggerthellaceae bacterium]|jgi:5-methylthioadenosine/S-adenosylhomocysteine deaminase|nr:amidohydrolase [Eggerthellaceae bacterium]